MLATGAGDFVSIKATIAYHPEVHSAPQKTHVSSHYASAGLNQLLGNALRGGALLEVCIGYRQSILVGCIP
jgi:hypothetical protein